MLLYTDLSNITIFFSNFFYVLNPHFKEFFSTYTITIPYCRFKICNVYIFIYCCR